MTASRSGGGECEKGSGVEWPDETLDDGCGGGVEAAGGGMGFALPNDWRRIVWAPAERRRLTRCGKLTACRSVSSAAIAPSGMLPSATSPPAACKPDRDAKEMVLRRETLAPEAERVASCCATRLSDR